MVDSHILHIIQHSLGVDQFGRGNQYRNHFVTGEGSTNYPACMAAVELGLMTRRDGNPLTGGDDLFQVTPAGKQWMSENSPTPPRLTRGQERYRAYIDSDTSMSFIEWLRSDGRRLPA